MTASTGWDHAPAGLLRLGLDGRVAAVNATLAAWLGRPPELVVGGLVPDLLPAGARLYWETHLSPLLHAEGRVDEVALELLVPDGRLPVLLSARVRGDGIDAALFPARERVRFERELRSARATAREAARAVGVLQEVTSAVSQAVGVEAVVAALLTAALGPLRGLGGVVWLPSPAGELVERGRRGETRSGAVPAGPFAEVVDDGRRVLVPLPGQRALQGVLALHPSTGPGAEPPDLRVCAAVGQQAGLALDRAVTYEQAADVAHRLQQSLLATPVPQDPRYEVATTYRPGVEALEVGGDWYDVFLVRPGVLALVVGDVVGRGLTAASAMGQLRSAVRAVAAPGVGPAALLTRLDRFVEQAPAAQMATVAYAELDLRTGRLSWSCAGHPPPLLLPGGPARLLWDGRSAPLGAGAAPLARPGAEVLLAPGDRVLLCTDGLYERRDRDLDAGLDRLVTVADGLRGVPLEQAVDDVTRELLVDEQTRDDVCVLLLSWTGDDFVQDLPADLSGLSELRRRLASWLSDRGVDEDARDDVVLATSEVVANAAEHGSGLDPGAAVRLTAGLAALPAGDEVVVRVRDRGVWRDRADGSPHRGRGLQIVRALVDEVDVQGGDGTTVVLRRRLGA